MARRLCGSASSSLVAAALRRAPRAPRPRQRQRLRLRTEDYFGYAWSSPEAFTAPYHAQTRVGGPENLGYFANNRFHILDSMPFTSGLEFRLEMWHWAETPIRLDRVAFWYGPKDQNPPPAIDLKKLALKEIK